MIHASHVVVDTRDGYTFWRGSDGALFTWETAEDFADSRNMDQREPTHKVFALQESPSLYRCSWGTGGDPGQQCDEPVPDPADDLCARHKRAAAALAAVGEVES